MAQSNPPVIQTDDRKRYTHQAYDVTFGGKNMEAGGVAGYGRRASATYEANFQITVDCEDTDPQYFMLPPFVYSNKYVIVEGGGGSPVASVKVADPADIPGTAVTLLAAADLSSTMNAEAAYDLGVTIDVEPKDQILEVEVTTPGTGYATMMIKADIVQTGWK